MNSTWYICVGERTITKDGHPAHECCVAAVSRDFDDFVQTVQQRTYKHKEARFYLYQWHQRGMLEYMGLFCPDMPLFSAINYGRSPHDGHGESLIAAAAVIAFEERIAIHGAFSFAGEQANATPPYTCIDECGAAVEAKGMRCNQCQYEVDSSSDR